MVSELLAACILATASSVEAGPQLLTQLSAELRHLRASATLAPSNARCPGSSESLNGLKSKPSQAKDDLLLEYDFASMKGGVRGNSVARLRKGGSNVVVLEPEIAAAFPSDAAVNEALRGVHYRQEGTVRVHGTTYAGEGIDDLPARWCTNRQICAIRDS